jgi:hypothetical protein
MTTKRLLNNEQISREQILGAARTALFSRVQLDSVYNQERICRLYVEAYKAGMERAANILDDVGASLQTDDKPNSFWMGVGATVDAGEVAIRAEAEKVKP